MPHLPLDVWVSIQPIHHSASDVTFVMVGQTPKAGLKNITVMISSRWAKKCSKRLLGVPGGSTFGPRTIFFSDNHNLNTTSTPPNQIIRYQHAVLLSIRARPAAGTTGTSACLRGAAQETWPLQSPPLPISCPYYQHQHSAHQLGLPDLS